ncbi:MAG: GNAT family N-acetyltransferase [Sulfitobacter sp.]|nr:GNAT family N-acetyltransferase [Sulfitobacter sp.]
MTEITIAPAETEADLEAVRRLCWAYRDFLLGNSPVDREITETFYPEPKYRDLMDQLALAHARPAGIILLARNAQGLALGCGMFHGLDAETAEIKRLFVTEKARGLGLARTLCRRLIDQARSDGYARVVLDTSGNLAAAQALYDSLGFDRRGPYEPIPEDVLPHLVFFEKRL